MTKCELFASGLDAHRATPAATAAVTNRTLKYRFVFMLLAAWENVLPTR
jgi:hypothetical protein